MNSQHKDISFTDSLNPMNISSSEDNVMFSHGPAIDELALQEEEKEAYEATKNILLSERMTLIAPLPSVVSMEDVTRRLNKKNSGKNYPNRLFTDATRPNANINNTHTSPQLESTMNATNATATDTAMEIHQAAHSYGIEDDRFYEVLDGTVNTTGVPTTYSLTQSTTGSFERNSRPDNEVTMVETDIYRRSFHHHRQYQELLDIVSLATPSRGLHELKKALEKLDGLEKEEMNLVTKVPLTQRLTELVTGKSVYHRDSADAIHNLELLGKAVPRRVCQHPFRKNDIVWVCRTCQADETCVLCHACFSQSNHEGHDVAFYHAQAGGCCDCGDPDGKLAECNSSFHTTFCVRTRPF